MLAEFELALASLADGGHALDYTVMHRITLSSIGLHCQAVPDRRMPVGSAFYPLPSISQRPFSDANSNQVQVW